MTIQPSDGVAAGDLIASLSDERGLLSAVLETSEHAIFAETFEGVILSWNAAAVSLLGYAAWEVIGRSEQMLLPAGGLDVVHGLLRRVRSGERVSATIERVHRSGRRVRLPQQLVPVRDAGGTVISAAAIIRPERRDVEELPAFATLVSRADVILPSNPCYLPASPQMSSLRSSCASRAAIGILSLCSST